MGDEADAVAPEEEGTNLDPIEGAEPQAEEVVEEAPPPPPAEEGILLQPNFNLISLTKSKANQK